MLQGAHQDFQAAPPKQVKIITITSNLIFVCIKNKYIAMQQQYLKHMYITIYYECNLSRS